MARVTFAGFVGQVPAFAPVKNDSDRSDFRDVPATDCGNERYDDRGMLGSYTPSAEPYKAPGDVRFFEGYGATAADLDRGYCVPATREDPAYDKRNYDMRSTQPKLPDEDQGNADWTGRDLEFRARNNRSRGFLTRPRIPTERG